MGNVRNVCMLPVPAVGSVVQFSFSRPGISDLESGSVAAFFRIKAWSVPRNDSMGVRRGGE